VFAVETKAHIKPMKDGKVEYRVLYDGKALQWPNATDLKSVEQARNNVKTLSVWLKSATGEKVSATPILTLPGWMVERKIPADGLYVLNPKQIYYVCASLPENLPAAQIARICHHLKDAEVVAFIWPEAENVIFLPGVRGQKSKDFSSNQA
jgi:hypothetical protein